MSDGGHRHKVVIIGSGFGGLFGTIGVLAAFDWDGKERWRMNGLNPTNNPNYRIIASPLVVRDIVIAPTRGIGVFVSMNAFSVGGFPAMVKAANNLVAELAPR